MECSNRRVRHTQTRRYRSKRLASIFQRAKFPEGASMYETSTDLYDAQNERTVLKIVLETEVNLANILARFRIINVHIDQGDGSAL